MIAERDRLRALLAECAAVLEPFVEASTHLHPALPDDGETLDGMKVREWRALAALVARLREEAK